MRKTVEPHPPAPRSIVVSLGNEKMFSDSFLNQHQGSNPSKVSVEHRLKSPPRSCEEWMVHENLDQWPCTTSSEALAETSLEPDSVLGSLDDIREDLQTNSPWGAGFLDDIEKRLQGLEDTLLALAGRFTYGSTPESVAGGLASIRDMTFLTELHDADLSISRKLRKTHSSNDGTESRTLESLVYPGISVGSSAVPFPGVLEPLHLLDLVTKSTSLPSHITKSWRKLFYSDSSCSLLQNTFWYVWLSFFKTKPDPEDLSRLFTVISENFIGLFYILEQKHKDKVFIYLPECLAKAVYCSFCRGFPKSNKIFNSEKFLSYLTNLTSEWITGVVSPPGSWRGWPRHLLNPYHSQSAEAVASSDRDTATHAALSEKDVMRLSIQDKPRTVRLCNTPTHTARGRRSRDHCSAVSRVKKTTKNVMEDEGVGVGEGPKFECVWFNLAARSPLLQHYLVTHGLVEEREGKMEGTMGPVVGRTQISQLPAPTVSYKQLLKSSEAAAKHNYGVFERELAKKEQEIAATRKKYNALLRAADSRNEKLLKHRYQVTIMAERIMNTRNSEPLKPTETTCSPSRPVLY